MSLIKEYAVPTLVVIIAALLFTLVLGSVVQNSTLQRPSVQNGASVSQTSQITQERGNDENEFEGGSIGVLVKVAILMGIPGLITVAILNRGGRSKAAQTEVGTA